jgi:hypothetical protein
MPEDRYKSMSPTRFWQEIYIAAVRAGQSPEYCLAMAQQALTNMQKLTGLVYPQGDKE